MPKVRLKIDNRRGLHARAAAKFVKLANLYDIEIIVTKDGQTVSGKSIMGLLMLAAMPGDKIIIETDSPFLSPVPYRGKRNQPSYIYNTAIFLSSLLNINFEEFANITTNNFYKIFTKATKYERIVYER